MPLDIQRIKFNLHGQIELLWFRYYMMNILFLQTWELPFNIAQAELAQVALLTHETMFS